MASAGGGFVLRRDHEDSFAGFGSDETEQERNEMSARKERDEEDALAARRRPQSRPQQRRKRARASARVTKRRHT